MAQSKPEITGTTHTLPFDLLSPRDFERLCLWLVEREGWERAEHLGAAGSEQGRDIIAWREGKLWAFQCKRVQHFYPAEAEVEVDKILRLPNDLRPAVLLFLATRDVSDETRQRARTLCADQIDCQFWALTELDEKVKRHPDIVREFFRIPEANAVYDRKKLGDKKISIYTYRICVADREEVKVEVNIPGGQLAGELRGSFGYTGEVAARIQQLHETVKAAGLEGTEVKELGETLFTTLFDDNLRRDFFGVYKRAQREDALLRIELDVDERQLSDVAALPWELMRVPSSMDYPVIWLGTAPGVGFSRRCVGWPMPEPVQLRSNERLRIALVVADPVESELSPVEYKEIWQHLEELVNIRPDYIELLELVNPATGVAIDAVLKQKPHIFHFIGHAQLGTNGQDVSGEIALLDDWVDAQRFGELFSRYCSCVVILQSCESAPPSAPQALMDVASHLVEQNVPAVIVTQYGVSNSIVGRFVSAFYNRLSQHEPLDKAAQEARRSTVLTSGRGLHAQRDSAALVLFMSVRDGYPFQPVYPGIPLEIRKVPTLHISYELNRIEQIARLESVLGRGGGGIIVWGRPHAGHDEFRHIATDIMRRRGITVLDAIYANDVDDPPTEEYFLSALEQRLAAEIASTGRENAQASARLWSALSNHRYALLPPKRRKRLQRKIDDRLNRIVAALQHRLDHGPTALIFFALEGVNEDVLHWLWEEIWTAHLERLTVQGLWALFFADTTSGKDWWKSSSIEPRFIVLNDIFQKEVTRFFVEQFRMNQSAAKRRAEHIFKPLLPPPVEPDNLYAALREDLRSEVWL